MFRRVAWLIGVMALGAVAAHAADNDTGSAATEAAPAAAEAAPEVPHDEFDRGTPRRALNGYFAATEAQDFELAANYLDLRNLPREVQSVGGPKLAQDLEVVLQRSLWIDIEGISDRPRGLDNDGLPSYRDRVGEITTESGVVVEVLLQRVPSGDGDFVWKFSNATVRHVPELYAELGYSPLTEALAEVFPPISIFGVELFKWAILVIAGLLLYPILLIAMRGLAKIVVKRDSPMGKQIEAFCTGPLLWLLMVGALSLTIYNLGLSAAAKNVAEAHTVSTVVITWVILALINLWRDVYVQRLRRQGKEGVAVLMGPLSAALKSMTVLMAVLVWLDNAGYNISALLAGLGVGGVSIALAMQKTFEDLFGALTLYTQQPMRVGDFCKFGDVTGTVEEIGLRTTRVRTMANTVVSIPNARLAYDVVDNYSVRRRIWYNPIVKLQYDTSRAQLDKILSATMAALEAHPDVLEEAARVRFTDFGMEGFEVTVHAYIATTDFARYLEVAQEVNLSIVDIVEGAGAKFGARLVEGAV